MSKKLIAVALVALMLLVLPASATMQATSVEVRGNVWNMDSAKPNISSTAVNASWDASNFAAFWYDLKDDLKTESLEMSTATTGADHRTVDENTLWYNTSKADKALKLEANQAGSSWTEIDNAFTSPSAGHYEVVGWMAQPYVAVKAKANKLAKLIIEQGNATAEKKTLTVGETWDIGDGWTLSAQSIDAKASPRQVWLVLSKDGVKKDDKVIGQGDNYVYVEKSFAGETDVPLFVTYVDSVFAGATTDMVQLRYTWAISTSVTEPKVNDKFGKMEVVTADSTAVRLKNKDTTLTLTRDGTVDVMGEIKFKIADSSDVRFYPMVEYEISGDGEAPAAAETTAAADDAADDAAADDAAADDAAADDAAADDAAADDAAADDAAEEPETPGFEAVFAIAGLLAVSFLVLRQRK